jgi:Domain of unknown function (DUF4129)
VRVDLSAALHPGARAGSRRTLVWSVVLAVIVVAAAGIAGTTHFGGARWVPNWHVSSGHKVLLPRSQKQSPPPPITAHHQGGFSVGTLLLWILIGLAAIGLLALLWRWWQGRPTRAAVSLNSLAVAATPTVPTEPEPESNTPALRTGIDLALQTLDEQRDPADAIVQAWLGLQETAEESGMARRPSETPTEFTSRILRGALADDRAINTLLRLYLRTRFGDHPPTQEDVAAVRVALQELVRTWPAPVPSARVGPR